MRLCVMDRWSEINSKIIAIKYKVGQQKIKIFQVAKKWLKCFVAHFRETLECAILVQLYGFIFKIGGDEES